MLKVSVVIFRTGLELECPAEFHAMEFCILRNSVIWNFAELCFTDFVIPLVWNFCGNSVEIPDSVKSEFSCIFFLRNNGHTTWSGWCLSCWKTGEGSHCPLRFVSEDHCLLRSVSAASCSYSCPCSWKGGRCSRASSQAEDLLHLNKITWLIICLFVFCYALKPQIPLTFFDRVK